MKSQFFEERSPEGIVFVNVQNTRDADHTAGCIFQRWIVKHALLLPGHHVRRPVLIGVAAEAALTAVAGHMAPPAGELVHREQAVVLTAPASGRGCSVGEGDDVVETERRGLLPVVTLPRDQSRAEGTHDTRNVRAGGLHARDLLKGAQHRLIIECAALDNDMAAELTRIGELDDLVQGVFDDGVGKTGGDVRDRCAFLLRLLDVGVHEHRAPRSEIHGMRGVQSALGKGFRRVAEGARKVFNKGPATGRTGFI